MKNLIFLLFIMACASISLNAQTKKDGTPDMRYKANKELYGNSYSTPSSKTPNYSAPTYSEPIYSTPSNKTPSFSEPKQERNYDNGGQLKLQDGYFKSDGTYVDPHLKTTPDNNKWNNLKDPE